MSKIVRLPNSLPIQTEDNKGKKRRWEATFIQPERFVLNGQEHDGLKLRHNGREESLIGYFRNALSRDRAINLIVGQSLDRMSVASLDYEEFFASYEETEGAKRLFAALPGQEILSEGFAEMSQGGHLLDILNRCQATRAENYIDNKIRMVFDGELLSLLTNGMIPRPLKKKIVIILSNTVPVPILKRRGLLVPKDVLWKNLILQHFLEV